MRTVNTMRTVAILTPNNEQKIGFQVSSFRVSRTTRNLTVETRNRISGGADRDRTGDPLLAKQVLSQLSYSPTSIL